MSKTLYRKYRPNTFSEVIGQEHIKITLENEILNDKISHAYLFSGPRGIGKTTIARILAKSVNCTNRKDFEPCNECENCISVINGNNLDLIEIDAASNRGINEIRELREMVRYSPSKNKYKIFIIDEVHMLTVEAFNALLKTLEEPPKHVIFILATTEFHKLPLTIISRCQKFDFKVIPIEKLKTHLKDVCVKENIKVDNDIIEKIARRSGGYARDALSILGQILSLSENNEVNSDTASLILPKSDFESITHLVDDIISQKFDFAIKVLDSLVSDGVNLNYFTEELINYIRKVILVKMSGVSEKYLWDVDKNIEEKIIEQSQKLDLKIWYGILKEFFSVFNELNNDRFKQLPLEMAIVSIKNKFFDNADYESKVISFKKEEVIKPITKKQSFIESSIKESNDENDIVFKETKNNKNINIEDITKAWPQLLINLKDCNHSLSAFVKSGHPICLENNKLTIGFQFKFHLDRIMSFKQVIEDTLSGIVGTKVFIDGDIDKDYEENRKKIIKDIYTDTSMEDNNNLNNLLDNFGGELV
ncbi:MAG: DNA polymerase III subunit gamma/tau [Patescibacteria group bacterium]|nr:DNA polymerase III subunit gamma/tau [Patescibacteria group bacterium]MDD4304254.1 DNA polymerase III subunit gamma/tau [Patescibacteria group bacterium]MDD4695308.1 DNA polymerase III subunit gamma/tau [Patescibacteria group bacterium]